MITKRKILPSADDVRQFVGEQMPARVASRRVLPGPEDNVAADRIGAGVDWPGGLRCFGIGVNPNAREVVPEARLHKAPVFVIQRLAGPGEGFVNDGRSFEMIACVAFRAFFARKLFCLAACATPAACAGRLAPGAGMRITCSATRSASSSCESPCAPTYNFV